MVVDLVIDPDDYWKLKVDCTNKITVLEESWLDLPNQIKALMGC